MLLTAWPTRAFALGEYAIDELSTAVTVETDGSAHVVERHVLTFDEQNAGVTWYLHVSESGESVRIDNIRVAPVDDGGTMLDGWTRLQMIDSDPAKQGRHPGDIAAASLRSGDTRPWYSYDIGDGIVRCWWPTDAATIARAPSQRNATTGDNSGTAGDDEAANSTSSANTAATADEPSGNGTGDEAAAGSSAADNDDGPTYRTYVIEADYTVRHRVRVFRDVAELYWRYAHDSMPADARNVNLQVIMPMPANADPTSASEGVRAWGHSPDGGSFSIGADGTATYRLDNLGRGHYAEAHVIFPASWMTNMTPNAANQFSELRGPRAISEETSWVDTYQRESAWDDKVRVLFLCIALVVIAAGVVGVARNGRSLRSRRALIRVAATLAIVGLGAHLFFREPLTVEILFAIAAIVGLVALALPVEDETP